MLGMRPSFFMSFGCSMRCLVFSAVLLNVLALAGGCADPQCPTGQLTTGKACITPEARLTIELLSGARSLLSFDPTVTSYTVAPDFLASELTLRVTPSSAVDLVSWRGLEQTLDPEGETTLSLDDGATALLRVTSSDSIDYEIEIRRATVAEFAQQAYVKSSDPRENFQFGSVVALGDDTMAIAEPFNAGGGRVIVFRRGEGGWAREAVLESAPREPLDLFGINVAIEGDTIVVGSALGVHIFIRSGALWSLDTRLITPESGDGAGFGFDVDIDSDTLVVGAPFEATDGMFSGAAYVYVRDESGWSEQAFLKANNVGADDFFGFPVAIDGDTIAVGAPEEGGSSVGVNGPDDDLSPRSGAAYVFVREGTDWSQQAYLKPSNTGVSDSFGDSVTIEDDTIVVGAPDEDGSASGVNRPQDDLAPGAGAVYAFVRQGTEWSQQAYIKASNTDGSDSFGSAVALNNDTLVVGAEEEAGGNAGINVDQADNSASESGAAYLFDRRGATWSQKAYIKSSNTGVEDLFGGAVALGSDTLVVGAVGEDGSASDVNGADDDLVMNAGAAYVFR